MPPAPVFQIGMQIAKAVPGRIDRLVVQLEPAALGRVDVRLKFHRNDQVSAVIAAERPDTLDALQRDARLLERSLHQAGLRLDSDGLTFSLKREQAHHQAREENWFAPSSERTRRPAAACPCAINRLRSTGSAACVLSTSGSDPRRDHPWKSPPPRITAPSTAASSRIGLADNFDNFLKLLTTQLQSQDPLSPMDANQFT